MFQESHVSQHDPENRNRRMAKKLEDFNSSLQFTSLVRFLCTRAIPQKWRWHSLDYRAVSFAKAHTSPCPTFKPHNCQRFENVPFWPQILRHPSNSPKRAMTLWTTGRCCWLKPIIPRVPHLNLINCQRFRNSRFAVRENC